MGSDLCVNSHSVWSPRPTGGPACSRLRGKLSGFLFRYKAAAPARISEAISFVLDQAVV